MIFYASYAFGSVFVICELGQRICDAYGEIDDLIEAFDWYLFSHEIQRLLPTILIVTQKPVVLKCFGSTSALRETFRIVCSYTKAYILNSQSTKFTFSGS